MLGFDQPKFVCQSFRPYPDKILIQAGTELCQAQVKLEVTINIVVEVRRSLSYFIAWLGGWVSGSTENINISSLN